MEAIPLSGINRHRTLYKAQDSSFIEEALFYPSKSIGRNELPDFVAIELVNQTPGKIYDSVESNGFLFSDSVGDLIDEDEYAIITDYEDNDDIGEDNLANGDAFVAITLENGKLSYNCKEIIGHKPYEKDHTKLPGNRNQVSDDLSINGSFKSETVNMSIVNNKRPGSIHLTKISPKKTTNTKNINHDNPTNEPSLANGDKGDDEENDLLYSYENPSSPNQDYEMKILAGRHDVSELTISTNDIEQEAETIPAINTFRLKSLSTRTRKSFDGGSTQFNSPNGNFSEIPLEDLQTLHREVIYNHENTNKTRLFQKRSCPQSIKDLQREGPVTVNSAPKNAGQTVPKRTNKNDKGDRLEKNISGANLSEKTMKRSVSEPLPPMNLDEETFSLDLLTKRLHVARKGRLAKKKKTEDDSFFEIDNRYAEFDDYFDHKPIEFEMKTIFCSGLPNDLDFLSSSTEFTSSRTSVEVVKKRKVSSRFISIFKQQKCDCKSITVAFFNVNQPKSIRNKLDVPCEEVIEKVYTHVIEEVFIYEDEFITCNEIECSICDDEWFIIK